ncbi:hypothetical protein S1OALGB6SA_2407 [Olavius algarvensis spirochete endosymbiont]|nr:MAG: hypothetical protein [Olavius algarvensis spirochete endosymbiont]VDB01303.1 hypothetical protein S1OALGB6SA_2407 [Olavius algarvensis spirochete endosymbiont]
MTIATDKPNGVIANIGSYMSQQKFKYRGECFHQKIFNEKKSNMYIYVEENGTSVILRIFIHHDMLYNRQISRRFSWLGFGIYSTCVSRICREITSVVSESDKSAQIEVEDKKEWYPVIIV